MSTLVYKLVPRDEWEAACAAGTFRGSEVDLRDGFIHLSSARQVAETARRHFAGRAHLLLVALDAATLGEALRWEPSRGGELFPHQHGPLDPGRVVWARALPLGDDGLHLLPPELTADAVALSAAEQARVSALLARVVDWARATGDVQAVALVGSHARGTARAGADVDLVILVPEPRVHLDDPAWPRRFGRLEHATIERWGILTAVRARYDDGLEVELGLAPPWWAAVDPVDPGTRSVVRGGLRPLHDPRGLLRALRDAAR